VFWMSASESRPLSSLSRNSILAISTRCCTPSHNIKMSFDVSHETTIATRATIKRGGTPKISTMCHWLAVRPHSPTLLPSTGVTDGWDTAGCGDGCGGGGGMPQGYRQRETEPVSFLRHYKHILRPRTRRSREGLGLLSSATSGLYSQPPLDATCEPGSSSRSRRAYRPIAPH